MFTQGLHTTSRSDRLGSEAARVARTSEWRAPKRINSGFYSISKLGDFSARCARRDACLVMADLRIALRAPAASGAENFEHARFSTHRRSYLIARITWICRSSMDDIVEWRSGDRLICRPAVSKRSRLHMDISRCGGAAARRPPPPIILPGG